MCDLDDAERGRKVKKMSSARRLKIYLNEKEE